MRLLRDAAAAFGFLTVLPLGRVWEEDDRPDGIPWYPLVGWFLGLAALALVIVAWLIGAAPVRNSWLLGVGVVALWAGLTRFLHWDGLADSTDGLLGAFERERRLEIMRDSRVGAFGAIAIVLVALAQVGAVGSLVAIGSWWPIVAAPVIARSAVVYSAWTIKPARAEGLGLTVTTARVPIMRRIIPAITLLGILLPMTIEYTAGNIGWSVAEIVAVLVVADIAALAIPRLLARGVGGVTGDLHGATVLLVETAVLVAAAVAA